MFDFLTEKQVSEKRERREDGCVDRLSLLPDPLLCQILLNLPTKDVVKTSLLSTRWRSLYLSVPVLELDDDAFLNDSAFVRFVDRFIGFSPDSPIVKLKITSTCDPLAIKTWVDAVVTRKIQHLEIDYSRREEVRFVNPVAIETLIASCPVLEDLSIITSQEDFKVMTRQREVALVIRQYCQLEPLPQFCFMSQLHAKIFAADLEMLPDLLESCPNLKSLILELNGTIKKDQISFSSVPWCLRSCLERVEMKKPIAGYEVEMKLIRDIDETMIEEIAFQTRPNLQLLLD
ncbi:hypothetical protein AALP_AA5G076300 [Arabis alpina]|uniref:F-box domain-containing protein n=1 Tax=Arabis alpina TaxID=50452 RepID=A0A087GVK4_ARAAL|nr:hypothetical protein AALP_AA5G076300 [Arabis alpina]